jgi:hypothetical protein
MGNRLGAEAGQGPDSRAGAGPGAARPDEELDRQLTVLLDKGYPELAGMSDDDLRARVDALRPQLAHARRSASGAVALLLVVRSRLVPTVAAVERFEVRGKTGWTDMGPELGDYRPIGGVRLPDSDVYLLVDVDTGAGTLNVSPRDALPTIVSAGRTPLTIDEGVALVTHFPSVFHERNAFQALGSRSDNKRIPSFWVSKGAPRLGWCWEGNPHTWLGAASAAARYGSG